MTNLDEHTVGIWMVTHRRDQNQVQDAFIFKGKKYPKSRIFQNFSFDGKNDMI